MESSSSFPFFSFPFSLIWYRPNLCQNARLNTAFVSLRRQPTVLGATAGFTRRLWSALVRGGSRGRVQGVHPPWDDLRFSETTGILPKKKTMWFVGVQVEQETNAPPPKKKSWICPCWLLIFSVHPFVYSYILISLFGAIALPVDSGRGRHFKSSPDSHFAKYFRFLYLVPWFQSTLRILEETQIIQVQVLNTRQQTRLHSIISHVF